MSDTDIEILKAIAIGLGAFLFLGLCFAGSSPPPKKEYKQSFKDKIAVENLRGKIKPEDLALRENISPEEVKQFTEEFLKDAEVFAENRRAMQDRIGELEVETEWFRRTCARFIGEDWETKTGYDKRNR